MLEIPVKLMNAKSGERKRMIIDYGTATLTALRTTITHKLGVVPVMIAFSDVQNVNNTGYQRVDYRPSDMKATDITAEVNAIPHIAGNVTNWVVYAFVDE